jgi:hypothetical protein
MRNALKMNQTLKLISDIDISRTRTFIISEELGSGASCIAYRAIDADNKIPVVIKECFPHSKANRETEGKVTWNSVAEEGRAKERFKSSYKMQLKIQSSDDLRNTSTQLIDGLYSCNNTLYTITNLDNTNTYNNVKDVSMQEVFKTAKALSLAAGKYHKHGLLHLDIKPQNILIYPGTREMIRLLDFDSVVKKNDTTRADIPLSYTLEYAAPELLQGKRNRLCDATDIYSIGAVIFNRVFGRAPTSEDRGTFSDWDFADNALFNRLSNKTKRLVKELLRKTLSASIKKRYQDTDELIEMLNVLIYESDPNKRYLNSTFFPSPNFFTGRNEELKQIHNAFTSGKRAVFLYGMGGIGKTELALHYAEQYSADYDVIAFGRYNDSLENLFKTREFISIENDAERALGIDAIRALVDERTLLLIDNFDVETDPKLNEMLSLKCKLLLTSRYSFKDIYSNETTISHIPIGEMPIHEQVLLFEHECGRSLTKEEHGVVLSIFREFEGNSLAIPLIAKLYQKDDLSLNDIKQQTQDYGIKGLSSVKVRHYKDAVISDSIYNHYCGVLDMFRLSEDEKRVISAISLLHGGTNSSVLISVLGNQHKDAINSLVDKHWVKQSATSQDNQKRVSLHNIIRCVARDMLKPHVKDCGWVYKLWLENYFTVIDFLEKDVADLLFTTLLTDENIPTGLKTAYLVWEISQLGFECGFDPVLPEEWIPRCTANKDSAKKCLDYIEHMIAEGFDFDNDENNLEPNSDFSNGMPDLNDKLQYYRHAIIIKCLSGSPDKAIIEYFMKKYFSHFVYVCYTECGDAWDFVDVITMYLALTSMGYHDYAKTLILEGIKHFEDLLRIDNDLLLVTIQKERIYGNNAEARIAGIFTHSRVMCCQGLLIMRYLIRETDEVVEQLIGEYLEKVSIITESVHNDCYKGRNAVKVWYYIDYTGRLFHYGNDHCKELGLGFDKLNIALIQNSYGLLEKELQHYQENEYQRNCILQNLIINAEIVNDVCRIEKYKNMQQELLK